MSRTEYESYLDSVYEDTARKRKTRKILGFITGVVVFSASLIAFATNIDGIDTYSDDFKPEGNDQLIHAGEFGLAALACGGMILAAVPEKRQQELN